MVKELFDSLIYIIGYAVATVGSVFIGVGLIYLMCNYIFLRFINIKDFMRIGREIMKEKKK